MKSLEFNVEEVTSSIFVQIAALSGRDDLFTTLYRLADQEGGEIVNVARSSLGKYSNSLGPVAITKGRYRLVVHPDLDSQEPVETK